MPDTRAHGVQDAARRRAERQRSHEAPCGDDAEALRAYMAEQADALSLLRQELEERMQSVAGAQVPVMPQSGHSRARHDVIATGRAVAFINPTVDR